MSPKDVKLALVSAFKVNRPIMMWGSPGIGKSDVVRQAAYEVFKDAPFCHVPTSKMQGATADDVAKQIGSRIVCDFRALLRDVIDLRGLPTIEGTTTVYTDPGDLPHNGDGKAVLFLDEINAAPPLVQAACYQLVWDRSIGDYKLPDYVRIVAAGNLDSDRAVTHAMPTPLRSRFTHIMFDVSNDDWIEWAVESNIHPMVVAFVRFRPELLHKFDDAAKGALTFPCPRTYHLLSDYMHEGLPSGIEQQFVAGTIGEGASSEFVAFIRVWREMPSLDGIIANPKKGKVPDDPATLYAVASGLSRRVTKANFAAVKTYCDRIPSSFATLCISDAIKRAPEIKTTEAMRKWAIENHEVLI